MTSMSITVNEYTARVLGVVKEKFGLKDRAEALDKFAEMFGGDFVEREIDDTVVKEIIKSSAEWEKKHNFKRKMSLKELDKLCGLE